MARTGKNSGSRLDRHSIRAQFTGPLEWTRIAIRRRRLQRSGRDGDGADAVFAGRCERGYGRRPEHYAARGGREGSTVIQRYPDDYDGVVANVPALNFSGLRLIGVRIGQDEYSEQHRRQIPTRCAVAQPLQRVQKGTRWTSMLGLAHSPQPLPRPAFVPNGYLFSQGDAYIKYFVTHDPTFDSAHFDVMRPGHHRQQVVWLSETIGAARRLGHARGCAGDAGCDRYRAGHQRAHAAVVQVSGVSAVCRERGSRSGR